MPLYESVKLNMYIVLDESNRAAKRKDTNGNVGVVILSFSDKKLPLYLPLMPKKNHVRLLFSKSVPQQSGRVQRLNS